MDKDTMAMESREHELPAEGGSPQTKGGRNPTGGKTAEVENEEDAPAKGSQPVRGKRQPNSAPHTREIQAQQSNGNNGGNLQLRNTGSPTTRDPQLNWTMGRT